MSYMCPVCGYPDMEREPADFEICSCCGTEFGLDDARKSVDQLRSTWIAKGFPWFSDYVSPPWNWNGITQLTDAGYFPRIDFRHTVESPRTVVSFTKLTNYQTPVV